ncbi:MAG: hypothetical protein IJ779_03955 [Ruminococcus sp.]|nr:hypothetical protein [Ruminococcus sp.]
MAGNKWEKSDFRELSANDNEFFLFSPTLSDIFFYELLDALQDYFNTYSHYFLMLNYEEDIRSGKINDRRREDNEFLHMYVKDYGYIIIRIHHFFELVIKEILEKCDPCFVINPKNEKEYIKMICFLKGSGDNGDSIDDIFFAEFSDALNRLVYMENNKLIEKYCTDLNTREAATETVKYKQSLQKLNQLRNSLIHRGRKVLSYEAFDDFMIEELLPLIMSVANSFKKMDFQDYIDLGLPLYGNIKGAINEMFELNKKTESKNFEYYGKIAAIKELCKGRYQLDYEMENSYSSCESEEKDYKECPCCGRKTLELVKHNLLNTIYGTMYSFYRCKDCTFKLEESIYDDFFKKA